MMTLILALTAKSAFGSENLEFAVRLMLRGDSCGMNATVTRPVATDLIEEEMRLRGETVVRVDIVDLLESIGREPNLSIGQCHDLMGRVVDETKRILLGPEGESMLEAKRNPPPETVEKEAEIFARAVAAMRHCFGWRVNDRELPAESPVRKRALAMVNEGQLQNQPSPSESCAVAEREYGPEGSVKKGLLIRSDG